MDENFIETSVLDVTKSETESLKLGTTQPKGIITEIRATKIYRNAKETVEKEFEKNQNNYSGVNRKVNLSRYFLSSQKWLGFVTEISENSFMARLKDLTSKGTDEEVEIDLKEISQDDQSLVKTGGVFYWNIGYANVDGTVEKKSTIRFQRLPAWSEEEFDSTIDDADDLFGDIKWE